MPRAERRFVRGDVTFLDFRHPPSRLPPRQRRLQAMDKSIDIATAALNGKAPAQLQDSNLLSSSHRAIDAAKQALGEGPTPHPILLDARPEDAKLQVGESLCRVGTSLVGARRNVSRNGRAGELAGGWWLAQAREKRWVQEQGVQSSSPSSQCPPAEAGRRVGTPAATGR